MRSPRQYLAAGALGVILTSSGVDAQQIPMWSLDRVLRVGSATDLESGFVRPGAVTVHDGQLVILERDNMTIRRFSLEGVFLGAFGGQGNGPGEFRALSRSGILNERLWVWDNRLSRLQFFDSDGSLDSLVTVHGHPTAPLGQFSVHGVLSGGSLLAVPRRSAHEEVDGPSDTSVLLRLDQQGVIEDTVSQLTWQTPVREITRELGLTGRRQYTLLPVMPANTQWAVARDGSSFVVVDPQLEGPGSPGFQVVKYNSTADTVWARRFPHTQIPVSRDWLEAEIQTQVATSAGDGSGIPVARWERAFQQAFADVRDYPPVSSVRAAMDGTTWLGIQKAEASFERLVLDKDGTPIGRLREPQGSRLAVAGLDTAWYWEEDDLGVPYLVAYSVIRR